MVDVMRMSYGGRMIQDAGGQYTRSAPYVFATYLFRGCEQHTSFCNVRHLISRNLKIYTADLPIWTHHRRIYNLAEMHWDLE